jgi:hypothetical protein
MDIIRFLDFLQNCCILDNETENILIEYGEYFGL